MAVLSPTRAHALRMRWRTGTATRRVLPDFVVIGGQRCGSTSLYTILCGHPEVMAASHKELHFFDMNWRRGTDFYRRSFPSEAISSDVPGGSAGMSSPARRAPITCSTRPSPSDWLRRFPRPA